MHSSVSIAEALLNAGNPRGAVEEAKKALALNPENIAAGLVLARALLKQSKLTEARSAAESVLRLDAENIDALQTLGASLTLQKQFKKGMRVAEQVILLAPDEAIGFFMRAICHEQMEKFRKATRDYRMGLARDPFGLTNGRAIFASFLINRGRLAEAAKLSEELTSQDAGSFDAVLLRANLALRDGRTEDAREDVLWALSQDAESKTAIHLLAQIKIKSNPLSGIWWRYAVWIERYSAGQRWAINMTILVAWFCSLILLVFFGLGILVGPFILAYFGFRILNWICPWLLRRMVNKELKSVEVKPF